MPVLSDLARPAWLPEPVWPWPTGALTTPAGRLAVTDAGTGPVLLFGPHRHVELRLARPARPLDPAFRCVTLDAPGNGRSYRPGAAGSPSPPRPPPPAPSSTRSTCTTSPSSRTTSAAPPGWPPRPPARPDRGDRRRQHLRLAPRRCGFRGMLAVMGSAACGERRLHGWLPGRPRPAGSASAGSGTRRTAPHSAPASAARAPAIHRYFADARHADALYPTVDTALRGPLADRPLLTVFGQ